MSEPRYRDWILETIDSLRSRKARPDLERICRMVRRRHGSDPERTRTELEKLIQERTVLKVSYKGSTSYRNAARVQRKGRRTNSGLERPSHDGAGTHDNSNIGNNNGNDGSYSNGSCDGKNNKSGGADGERALGPADREHEREKPEPSRSAAGGGGGGGGGLESCAKSSSEHRDAAEARERETCGEQPAEPESNNERESLSARAAAAGGHALLGLREVLGCLSAREQDETLTRRRARALLLERETLESNGNNNNSARRKKTMMMMMMMTKSKNKAGRVQQQEQQRGTGARVLAHTGSGGGGGGGAAAAEGARLSKKKKKKKKKKKRQSGGGGGAGGGARDDESKEEEKDEDPVETESEEEEKMEEEDKGSASVDTQAAKSEGQEGVVSHVHSPLSVSLEVKTSNGVQSEENLQALMPASPPKSKLSSVHQEADSEGGHINQVESFGTESLGEEQRAATGNQLQTNTQNQAGVEPDSVMIPSSIPIKSYSGCKTEVGVSSCLLTPSASPGAAEERGMNGGVFVKSETAIVNPVDWTVADVASYFTAVGFPEQALAFRMQEIDGKSLLLMQRNDVLTGLSIRLGPALKIYERHVKVLQRTHFQDDEAFC